jgi:hypothetical protein
VEEPVEEPVGGAPVEELNTSVSVFVPETAFHSNFNSSSRRSPIAFLAIFSIS